MGIQRDVGLVGQQYALLGTILYVGILVGEVSSADPDNDTTDPQVPANRIIQLFPIAKFLGCLVICWVSPELVNVTDCRELWSCVMLLVRLGQDLWSFASCLDFSKGKRISEYS